MTWPSCPSWQRLLLSLPSMCFFHRSISNGKRYLNDSSCLFNIGQTLPELFGFECCIPFRTKKAGKMSFASRPQRQVIGERSTWKQLTSNFRELVLGLFPTLALGYPSLEVLSWPKQKYLEMPAKAAHLGFWVRAHLQHTVVWAGVGPVYADSFSLYASFQSSSFLCASKLGFPKVAQWSREDDKHRMQDTQICGKTTGAKHGNGRCPPVHWYDWHPWQTISTIYKIDIHCCRLKHVLFFLFFYLDSWRFMRHWQQRSIRES